MLKLLLAAMVILTPIRVEAQAASMNSVQHESIQDFIDLIPLIVQSVPAPLLHERPLLVDLRSFVYAGSALTRIDLDPGVVSAAFGRSFVDVDLDRAIEKKSEYRIEVLHDGVHLRLDGLSRLGSSYTAYLTYTLTERREGSSALAITQMYVMAIRDGGGWRHILRHVLNTS